MTHNIEPTTYNPKSFHPADKIQDLQYFGEFGGVNPSISDSSTYTFLSAKTMFDTFEGNAEGCYLYSRHSSPMNLYLGQALAAMEEELTQAKAKLAEYESKKVEEPMAMEDEELVVEVEDDEMMLPKAKAKAKK
jgi:hypothetical protein